MSETIAEMPSSETLENEVLAAEAEQRRVEQRLTDLEAEATAYAEEQISGRAGKDLEKRRTANYAEQQRLRDDHAALGALARRKREEMVAAVSREANERRLAHLREGHRLAEQREAAARDVQVAIDALGAAMTRLRALSQPLRNAVHAGSPRRSPLGIGWGRVVEDDRHVEQMLINALRHVGCQAKYATDDREGRPPAGYEDFGARLEEEQSIFFAKLVSET